MAPYFALSFGTSSGSTRTLRINNVNPLAEDINVRNAMNAMIASQAIASVASGHINSLRRAQKVESTVTPIVLP